MADEQGVMAAVENSTKVLNAFSALGDAASSVDSLYKLFSGAPNADSQVLNALAELTKAVTEGLENVTLATKDETNLQRWEPTSKNLSDWQARIDLRSDQLAGANAKTLMVEADHDVPIATWCEKGMSDEKIGALDDIIGVLKEMATLLTAGTDGDTPLDRWDQLSRTGTAGRAFGESNDTLYAQLLGFQSTLLGIVQSATVLYNSLLALYWQTPNPLEEYTTLDFELRVLSGSPGKKPLWPAIETMLAGYRALGAADDLGICSRESFQDPAPPPQNRFGYYPDGWFNDPSGKTHYVPDDGWVPDQIHGQPVFLLGETLSSGNSYFTGLNFEDTTIGPYRYWFLQGTLATINPDGTRTLKRYQSDLNDMVAKGAMPTDGPSIHRLDTYDFQYCGDYVAEPAEPSDGSSVVTGFKIELVGDVLCIALQYGVLIIDKDGKQRVDRRDSSFHLPDPGSRWWWDKGDIAWVDKEVAATESNLPLTNATFDRVNDGTGHYHLTIRARTAWTGYKADVMQPTHLIQFSPVRPTATKQQAQAAMPPAT